MPNVAIEPSFVGLTTSSTTVGSSTPVPVPAAAMSLRTMLVVYNNGTDWIYCGGSSVAAGTGVPISPGGERVFSLSWRVALYAIAASGNQDVRTLEMA